MGSCSPVPRPRPSNKPPSTSSRRCAIAWSASPSACGGFFPRERLTICPCQKPPPHVSPQAAPCSSPAHRISFAPACNVIKSRREDCHSTTTVRSRQSPRAAGDVPRLEVHGHVGPAFRHPQCGAPRTAADHFRGSANSISRPPVQGLSPAAEPTGKPPPPHLLLRPACACEFACWCRTHPRGSGDRSGSFRPRIGGCRCLNMSILEAPALRAKCSDACVSIGLRRDDSGRRGVIKHAEMRNG